MMRATAPRLAGRRSGMTLLELTIGLVVTGLIVSAGYMAFSTVIDRRDAAKQTMAATARATELRQTLTRWLRNSTLQFPSVTTTDSELNFVTFGSSTPIETPGAAVRLFVNHNASFVASAFSAPLGRGLIAVLKPDAGNDSTFVMLDSTITDMRAETFVIMNRVKNGWIPIENAQAQSNNFAVRVHLRSSDPQLDAALMRPIEVPTASGQ